MALACLHTFLYYPPTILISSAHIVLYRWLREEIATKRAGAKKRVEDYSEDGGEKMDLAEWSNGWAAGRMTSTLRDSSNAVMRM